MPEFKELFSRNLGTLLPEQQESLQQKKVAVIGCGGLGGHVIEQLVRLGVGCIHCFDPDVFSLSNCNRQLNASRETLGRNKAEVAARRSAVIHPYARVVPFPVDFRSPLQGDAFAVDVVIDCLDNIQARRDLSGRCKQDGLPLVHGAVYGWCGQVGVQPPEGDLIGRLYPQHAATDPEAPPSVIACTVALVASLQVGEALKLLLRVSSDLDNSWLFIDLKHSEFIINP
jgi:molybdopterin/thiamine biosynthesis adenylyltransferase